MYDPRRSFHPNVRNDDDGQICAGRGVFLGLFLASLHSLSNEILFDLYVLVEDSSRSTGSLCECRPEEG